MPGEQVRMIIEIDNSNCSADVSGIHIGVINTVGLRSSGGSTSDRIHVFSKGVKGLPAGTKMVVRIGIYCRAMRLLRKGSYYRPTAKSNPHVRVNCYQATST